MDVVVVVVVQYVNRARTRVMLRFHNADRILIRLGSGARRPEGIPFYRAHYRKDGALRIGKISGTSKRSIRSERRGIKSLLMTSTGPNEIETRLSDGNLIALVAVRNGRDLVGKPKAVVYEIESLVECQAERITIFSVIFLGTVLI